MAENNEQDIFSFVSDSVRRDENSAIEANDNTLNNAVTQQIAQDREYDERNTLYTILLRNYIYSYVEKDNEKKRYKKIFFYITILTMVAIVAISLIIMVYIAACGKGNLSDIGAIAGGIAGMITALIIIPRIIAEHLFPVNEDSNMIDMVKNMQDNDTNIRNVLYGITNIEDKKKEG